MVSVGHGGDERPDPNEPGAAIHVGERRAFETEASRWGFFLVVFMRILAAIWIFQGLDAWARLLMPGRSLIETAPHSVSGAIVFFAVFDLVAAVGLWLATPWGGVLWLFAVFLQMFATVALRNLFGLGWMPLDIACIVIYFGLTWQAGKASDQYRTLERRKPGLRKVFGGR